MGVQQMEEQKIKEGLSTVSYTHLDVYKRQGVIGMQVPIDRIKNGVKMMAPKLDGSLEAGTEAAKAIMTTDKMCIRDR